MHLICRQCSTRLTLDLHLVPLNMPDRLLGGEPMVAPGTTMREDGSYSKREVGSFLANAADVEHVKLTSDTRRLAGCCGLDGCDGPNLQCEVCGTYVATKRSDCWTPHFIAFDPVATQVVGEDV